MARSAHVLLGVLLLTASAAGQVAAAPGDDTARADATWEPVQELAPSAGGATLTVDGRGTTTLVWSTTAYPTEVVARQRLADGSWTPETVLGTGAEPEVVADRGGTVTVVWILRGEGTGDVVLASRRTPSQGWSPPAVLSPRAARSSTGASRASQLDVAASRGGDIIAAWVSGDPEAGRTSRIRSAFRPRDGRWRTAVDVSPANGADEPSVGVTAGGAATVVYGVQPRGRPQALVSRIRRRDGQWGPSVRVAAEGYGHDLAVARDGTSVVVFTPDFSSLLASTRDGARWGRPHRLLRGGELNSAVVDVDARGRFVVGAARDKGRVDVVVRRDGRPWSPARRLAAGSTSASEVIVAVNAAGDTFVGWGSYGVSGRLRPRGSTWSQPYSAWPDTGVDVLEWAGAAMAPDGDVSVLWDQEEAPLRARVLLVDS